MSDIDHGPSLLYFFPERPDRGLILLRKLEGCLDLRRIVDNLAVELATFLNQPLFLLVRFLQCAVQLFILEPVFIEERETGTPRERESSSVLLPIYSHKASTSLVYKAVAALCCCVE